jgi:hypothetical protein
MKLALTLNRLQSVDFVLMFDPYFCDIHAAHRYFIGYIVTGNQLTAPFYL